MPGRYSKVLLRKGLSRQADGTGAPRTPVSPRAAERRAVDRAEEQILFDETPPRDRGDVRDDRDGSGARPG